MAYNGDSNIQNLNFAYPLLDGHYMIIQQSANEESKKVSLETLANYFNGKVTFVHEGALADCRVATTANLATTYNNAAGTLTATSNGAISVDGVSLSLNDRVLVWQQTTAYENGIYTVTTVGDGSNPYVLTRASDADVFSEFSNQTVAVVSGDTYSGYTFWFATQSTGVIGTDDVTINVFFIGVLDHNQLNNLNTGDYQHLTSAELNALTGGTSADGQHTHPSYMKKTYTITGGDVLERVGNVNSSNRYIQIDVPVNTSGDMIYAPVLIECTIHGKTGASFNTSKEPIKLNIVVNREDDTTENAIITANITGNTGIDNIYLYNNTSTPSDVIFIDMVNFNSYNCVVDRITSYDGADDIEASSIDITSSGSLIYVLVDTYNASIPITYKSLVQSESVAFGASIALDSEDYNEKVFTTTATGDFTLGISNTVEGGVYQHVITKNTASDVTITLSGTWYVSNDAGFESNNTIVLSGNTGAIYILAIQYVGSKLLVKLVQ